MPDSDWQKIASPIPGGIRLHVKITPGAAKTKILGPHGDCIKIAVAAPPEKGKANHALIEFLAKTLGVPKAGISLAAGMTSPRKTLRIEGVTWETCLAALSV